MFLTNGVAGADDPGQLRRHRHTGTLPLPNNLGIRRLNTADYDRRPHRRHRARRSATSSRSTAAPGNPRRSGASASAITVRGNSIFRQRQGLGSRQSIPRASTRTIPETRDTGPNAGQNYPLISSVQLRARRTPATRRAGLLRSAPSTTYTLDFYANDGCRPRPQDFLEARTWLGAAEVTTDGSGSTPHRRHASRRPRSGRHRVGDRDGSRRQHVGVLADGFRSRSSPRAATPAAAAITLTGSDFAAGRP